MLYLLKTKFSWSKTKRAEYSLFKQATSLAQYLSIKMNLMISREWIWIILQFTIKLFTMHIRAKIPHHSLLIEILWRAPKARHLVSQARWRKWDALKMEPWNLDNKISLCRMLIHHRSKSKIETTEDGEQIETTSSLYPDKNILLTLTLSSQRSSTQGTIPFKADLTPVK